LKTEPLIEFGNLCREFVELGWLALKVRKISGNKTKIDCSDRFRPCLIERESQRSWRVDE
jgi:hypothetical protein